MPLWPPSDARLPVFLGFAPAAPADWSTPRVAATLVPAHDREDTVIVRAFHATATAEGADAYREHFTNSVLPDLQRIDGYRGAYLLRHDHDGGVELQVLTLWSSLDAIRRFAGASLDTAVVEPAAKAVLATYDTKVTHHTVVVDTVAAG
jgi:heme-degrading monooxygenase HmoA